MMINDTTAPTSSAPFARLEDAERALHAWLRANVQHFDPTSDAAHDGETFHKLKAFDELCLFLMIDQRLGGTSRVPQALHDFVRQTCADPRFLASVVTSPKKLLLYVYPVLYMQRAGLSLGEPLAAFAESVLANDLYHSTERAPHRILDGLFCLWLLRPDHERLALYDAAWSVGNGTSLPHAAWSDLADYYAYTHNVFYATRLGIDGGRDLPPADGAEETLEFGILRFLAESNLDIALELVICQLLTGARDASGAATIALLQLLSSIQRDGYAPGPSVKGEEFYVGAAATWYRNYHTTIVAAILLRFANGPQRDRLAQLIDRDDAARVPYGALLRAGRVLSELADAEIDRPRAERTLDDLRGMLPATFMRRLSGYLDRLPDWAR